MMILCIVAKVCFKMISLPVCSFCVTNKCKELQIFGLIFVSLESALLVITKMLFINSNMIDLAT